MLDGSRRNLNASADGLAFWAAKRGRGSYREAIEVERHCGLFCRSRSFRPGHGIANLKACQLIGILETPIARKDAMFHGIDCLTEAGLVRSAVEWLC